MSTKMNIRLGAYIIRNINSVFLKVTQSERKYTTKHLAYWIRTRIQKEKEQSYQAILAILAGVVIGVVIAFLRMDDIPFLDVVVNITTLGISLSTIIGVFYYLYKSDEIHDRKSDFLFHIDQKIEENELSNETIKAKVMQDIVVDILKEKINETTELTMLKDNGGKQS